MRRATTCWHRFVGVWLPLGALLGVWNAPTDTLLASESKKGVVSWYGIESCEYWKQQGRFDCPTASGRSLHELTGQPYMAAWFGSFGSQWRVCGQAGCAVGQLWDRGPAKRLNRIADLSPTLFHAVCGELARGICLVELTEVK